MIKLKHFLYILLAISVSILAGIAGVIMFSYSLTSNTETKVYLDINEVPARQYALLLGVSKEKNDTVANIYDQRVLAAAKLYLNGKVKKIIVSGGIDLESNKGFYTNHVFSMKSDLVLLGVDKSDIIEDHEGYRTLDSIARCKKTYNITDPIIVSQFSHCIRALYQAKHYRLNAIAYAVATDNFNERITTNQRESLARVLAVLDLKVLSTSAKSYASPAVFSSDIKDENETINN